MKFRMTTSLAGVALMFVAASASAEPVPGLMSPNILTDTFSGAASAPVTLVVYSSPTCSHCIDFHDDELPKLQEKYVASGKLKIAYRPFVRNSVDAVVFMLAQSRGPTKFDETVSAFMAKFDEIAAAENTEEALRGIAGGMGIDRAAFDRAVANQAYLDKLHAATAEANQKFAVAGTPSFFVNGEQVLVKKSFDEIAEAVESATR